MRNTFHRYATKDPIEVDATLAKLNNNILKIMKLFKLFVGDEMSS